MKTFKLHLIRHGLTDANFKGIYAGSGTDLPLSEEGTRQLKQLREDFSPEVAAMATSLLQELGRWYNYGVVFYNKEAMAYAMHFSASREESLEEAVGHLNRLRKFRVEIEGQDIVVY